MNANLRTNFVKSVKTAKIFDGSAVCNPQVAEIPPKQPYFLDTLAQLDSPFIHNGFKGVVLPSGSDSSDGLVKLQKRAKSKYFTQVIALPLANLHNKLEKYYMHAYGCTSVLQQRGLEITSKYCNTRLCNTCNRIRTAKMINGYSSELAKYPNKRFLTLTIPNCSAEDIETTIADMQKCLFKIKGQMKWHKMKFAGLRKLEITYNAIKDNYHPHFHLMIDSPENAEFILEKWLKMNPDANRGAQNIRDVDDATMIELFKYSTKVITDVKGKGIVYVNAVDTIMRAIYGKRIIQPFGDITKQVSEEVEEVQAQVYHGIPEYDMMEWVWEKQDYVNEYGELLTGHTPSPEIQALRIVNKKIVENKVIHSKFNTFVT